MLDRVAKVSFPASAGLLFFGCASLGPGQQAIDSVTLRGTRAVRAADVEGGLATGASPKFLGVFRGVVYDYAIFNGARLQRDLARVERYYRARGYYGAHARAGRVTTGTNRHVRVEIVIEEGPPTVNRDLIIKGIETLAPPVRAAVTKAAAAALPKGQAFDEAAAAKCEADARKALTDLGYAYATIKRDTDVDIVHLVANTTLAIVPGDVATFGPITIQGPDVAKGGVRLERVSEAPLRRAIDIAPGSPYSTARIDAATAALLDLQVFAAVTIVPDLSRPERRAVPLTVHVESSKLREVRLGGGIEFDELKGEVHLLARWEDHDFLGGLRDFSVDFRPGLVFYPTRTNDLVAPTHLFPEEKLRLQLKQAGFLEARTEGFIRPEFNIFPLLVQTSPSASDPVVGYQEFKAAVGVDRRFFKWLFASISYNAQIEAPFSYKDPLDPDLSTLVILYPEIVAQFDFRDDRERPHAGIYLATDLQVAGGIFGGGPRDVRTQSEVRTYVPVTSNVTLASRASVGLLVPSNYGSVVEDQLSNAVTAANRQERVSDIETVLFRGLFSGGPTSNRGFVLRGVAPHGVVPFLTPGTSAQAAASCDPPSSLNNFAQPNPNLCSIPIGGFTLWELSNELRFTVSGPLSSAIFCDMGDVSPRQLGQSQAFRFDHLHLSCGIGARYETPAGPIRLDIGYRIQPLQVLGFPNETAAYNADHANGVQPTFFGTSTPGTGLPIAIAVGIGEAY
ncbi:MAG: BamA/TamA family outer membrane protein [Polyangiaceae bacterium]